MEEQIKAATVPAGLNDSAKQIHAAAAAKGFWDKKQELGTILMLTVSELGEALEADRKGRHADLDEFFKSALMLSKQKVDAFYKTLFEENIKDTFEDEIADTMIRLLDLCGAYGINIEAHINLKLKYNKTREKLHGKRY